MRTRVTCSFSFEAAHRLPWHGGKCRRLHGHHYALEVTVEGPIGPDGVVVDFAELEEIVNKLVVARFDHQLLNDIVDNPTAELVAREAWELLEPSVPGLARLRLWETPGSSVELLA